jgi:hypothetical protein
MYITMPRGEGVQILSEGKQVIMSKTSKHWSIPKRPMADVYALQSMTFMGDVQTIGT